MAGLMDIAPTRASKIVDGVSVVITGVSLNAIVGLINRFPEIEVMISGGQIDVSKVMSMSSAAVAAVIAEGCGEGGNKEVEEHVSRLLPNQQVDLVEAIIDHTFPGGFGPFMDRIEKIGNKFSVKVSKIRTSRSYSRSIAAAVEQLIAAGHDQIDVWGYTPKRLFGFLSLLNRRRRIEAQEFLSLSLLSARGEKKDLEKVMKELRTDD